MRAKEIYDILIAGGLTPAGAKGLIGNMMGEATPELIPNIVERGRTGLSDTEYTMLADSGQIPFAGDAIGYGLCQWTFRTRKQGLLDYARSMGTSVGDGVMQCYYALVELKTGPEFANCYKVLRTSDNIDECSDVVCREFERPSVCNYETRRAYAHKAAREIEAELANNGKDTNVPTTPASSPAPVTVYNQQRDVILLQLAMQEDGAWDKPIDGLATAEWYEAFREYTKAVLGGKI